MKKIVTIGGATRDVFIQYEDAEMVHLHTETGEKSFLILEEGKKIEVDRLSYFTGGGATNSAVSFKQLGYKTAAFFIIGNDHEGVFILDELKKMGIATDTATKISDMPTATSFIIPTPSGDRTVLVFRGASLHMQEKDIPHALIHASNQLYITSLSGPSSQLLLPIVQSAKQKKIPVATNPGTSQLKADADILCKSLPYIDILILNSYEANLFMASLVQTSEDLQKKLIQQPAQALSTPAPQLMQAPITYQNICFNISHFFQEVLSRGPKIVVITNGAEGVYVATNNSILFHPSLPVDVVNTLGAGDAFGSCFVASLVDNNPVEDAIRHGIINSASVISYLDAKTGLLSKDELADRAQKLDQSLLRLFRL